MAIIKYSAICKVQANLIMADRKTIDDVKESYKEGTMIALCAKKIIAKQISFKAVIGDEAEAAKYANDICTGFAKDNTDYQDTIVAYLEDEGKGYLAM